MRIELVLLVSLFIAACGEGAKTAAPPSRFEAVSAKPAAADPLVELCDVRFEAGKGPALALPVLEAARDQAPSGAQWLNLWATWCKPCVEELPMIARWRDDLAKQGTSLQVHFVSVDATSDLVKTFREQHPGLPGTERIADPSTLTSYVQALGLDATAGLPVHAFTGPDGRVRCVRSGAVLESHFDAIATLFK
jgi:thiol-disulfide isomerase/thioredoxin